MNKIELGLYIDNFVKLNPKKNTRPNIVKFEQNSFFVIQNCFKENKKYIITSNYNDIFYYKKSKLVGKKWIEILLSSKDIFEYHKRIRDDFPYCKPRKLIRILINDLFYLFKNNIPNILIEDTEKKFNNELKNQLEKIRKFLDDQDWSNYFFNLQTIMHEQIIKFLGWNKNLNFNDYSNLFFKKMILFVKVERVKKLLQFIQKVNLYRNTLSKPNSIDKEYSKRLLNEWNTLTKLMKVIEAKHIYNQLLDFIDIINLLKNKKSI